MESVSYGRTCVIGTKRQMARTHEINLQLSPPRMPAKSSHNEHNFTHSTLTCDLNPFAAAVSTALPVKVKIEVGEGEPIESALRRFKRQVNQSGHLMELRHKRYFENSQERKKRKIVQARFRVRMERMNARRMRKQRT